MVKEFTKKALTTMEDTIFAYDKSIYDLENGEDFGKVFNKWRSYGRGCRLCSALSWDCSECPLGGGDGCCTGPTMGPTYDKLENLARNDNNPTKRKLLSALKARREALLQQFSRNGWELK